jgi:hypothetical protein
MSCSIGLHKVVEGILDNKPWFFYKKDGNFGLISILDSPSKKINLKTSTGVAKTVADAINTVINDGYKDIGKVAYLGFDATGRGMVKIEPTNNQLNLINATDDSKEIYELQKQVKEEAKQKEEAKPKETLSQEIQENREYFENDEPFTRTSTNIKISTTEEITNVIKNQLPKEIANAVTVVQDVPLDILGRQDLFLSMKDVLEEKGITNPFLINWFGINLSANTSRGQIIKSITSEAQIEKMANDSYNKLLKLEDPILKNKDIKKSFDKWVKALENYPVVFKDLMLKHAIKHLRNPERRSKFVLQLSAVALQQTYGIAVNKPHELNRIGKLYDSEVLKTVSDAVGHEPSASGKGYWVHIPRTSSSNYLGFSSYEDFKENREKQIAEWEEIKNNPWTVSVVMGPIIQRFKTENEAIVFSMDKKNVSVDKNPHNEDYKIEKFKKELEDVEPENWKNNSQFKVNVELLRKLSPSTWCTASGMASHYVENYDNYLLIVDGVTVAGIEAYPGVDNSEKIQDLENKIKDLENNESYTIVDRNRIKGQPSTFTTTIKPFMGVKYQLSANSREEILNKEENTIKRINEDLQTELKYLKIKIQNLLEESELRKVKEVTSRANNGTSSIDHYDDILAFFEKHNLDTNNDSLNRAKKAKEAGKVDADEKVFDIYGYDWDPADFYPDDDRDDIEGEYRREREENERLFEEDLERRSTAVENLNTVEEVLQNPDYLEFFELLKPELRNNEEIARIGVESSPYNITHIDENLPFYNELVTMAVTKTPDVFSYLPHNIKEERIDLKKIYEDNIIKRDKETEEKLLKKQAEQEATALERSVKYNQTILEKYKVENPTFTLAQILNKMDYDGFDLDELPFSKTNTNQIQGYYDAKADKVVVVASNTPIEEASKVGIHEVAHRGMIRMAKELGGVQELGKVLFSAEKQLMEKLPELLKRTGHTSLENLMLDYGFTNQSEEGKIKLLMELAARWAETLIDKPKPSWWKEFLTSIQTWITKFTGKILNEKEVNELIGGFVKYGTKSNNNNTTNNTNQQDSLFSQEEANIKLGVEELFESDSNLANEVYEALGFQSNKKINEQENELKKLILEIDKVALNKIYQAKKNDIIKIGDYTFIFDGEYFKSEDDAGEFYKTPEELGNAYFDIEYGSPKQKISLNVLLSNLKTDNFEILGEKIKADKKLLEVKDANTNNLINPFINSAIQQPLYVGDKRKSLVNNKHPYQEPQYQGIYLSQDKSTTHVATSSKILTVFANVKNVKTISYDEYSKNQLKLKEVYNQYDAIEILPPSFVTGGKSDFIVFNNTNLYEVNSIAQITPQQKQQALQQYSQYLDQIFPNSVVKNIVYHGTDKIFESFSKNIEKIPNREISNTANAYFFSNDLSRIKDYGKNKINAILNVKEFLGFKNISNDRARVLSDMTYEKAKGYTDRNIDSVIADYDLYKDYIVFEPEQIHILGSKQDIERFKDFVNKGSNQNNENNTDTSTDTEVRKILNTPIVIEQEVTSSKDNTTDDLVEIKESEVKKKLQEILKILGITIERDADLPKDTLAKVDMLQKLISFSKGELTEDNFTEEVIHLIINIIEQKDPTLYDKMISEIWKFGIYKEVLDNYKDDPEYQTKEGKPDIAKLKKEAVVKLLVAKLVDNTNINDTKNIFGALWDKVSDFITNLFSKIPAYQRDLFEEFANDIVTKDNLINKEDVDKLGDGVFYSKKMSKANIFSSTMAKTKKAFGVASVEDYHLIIPSLKDSKEIFDLLKKINEETSLVVAREINPETGKEEEVTYYVTGTGMKKRVSTVLNEIKTNIGNYKTIDETEITAFIKEEKMKKGTEIHSTIEEIIGRHIDKETGFLKVTPEDRPQNIAIPEKYYNILEKHLKERLISYPKDTRFMVETKIVNEVYGYAGTIDFLAILPTGQVDILDWKSMDLSYNIGGKSMKREDVHALTKQVHRQQLALYKQALLSVGVKNFRQTRTIPIIVENTTKKINKSKSFEDPKNLVIRLTSLEIGNVDPNKEAKSYLLPISTSNEEVFDDITGKPISFLNTLIEKLEAYKAHSLEQRAQSTTLDRDRLLDQIQRTDKTIQELRSKKTTNLLITVFEDELFNINELSKKTFSFLKDNKNLSDLIPEQQQELRLYFDKMYENHNFLSSFLKVFPTLGELETIHKDMSPELVKSINSVKAKITISEEKLTVAVTKTMNQVGTILGMDDNVSDIDVKSSTMINSYSLYSRPELSLQMFTRLQKMINYLKEQEVQSFDSKMEKLMVGLQSWVKTNKTNLEVYDKVNRRLIYKYKKEYFQTLFDKKEEAIKKHRDIIKGVSIQLSSKERITQISKEYRAYITPFIKENYDIKKYVQLYEEAYKAYKEVVDNYIFDADPFENADIQAKKLEEWEYRHNIFTNPKALQTSGFNKNELLFQTINEDKWISDEYRELLKPENKEVFDFYNQLQDILTDAKDSGMIESLNNLPEVKNDSFKIFTYLKAGLFKNYILSKFYAFYDRFLTNTYSSQNISDPFTNKDKKKIRSKYNNTFFLKRKPLESPEAYQERYNKEKVLYDMSLSKDLFYIFSVFGHHVIEYKILKEYESRFQLLSIVENNKTKEINTDNSKGNITLPLDDSGMPYYDDNKKLGITEGDKGTLRDLNRHIDYYLYNDKLAPKGALINIVNWLYSLTTQVNLGFTYTAPLTNLVAGLTNSTLTNNTYYNSSDFQNSILPAIKDKNTAVNVKNFTKLNKMFNPFVEMSDQVYTTNKYKTTEKRYINVTKASLFLYSAGDHIIQSKIIASIYYGTTVDENNNIISVEDFINNKYPDRYNLPKEERIKLAKKIDKEIKEYKKTNSLYNLVSTNSLNLDAKNNILLTSIIEDTIAKTLGNYSEQDINTFMTKWWAKFVTQHKKWLGETIATRLEPFNVNKNTNLLEWGRMRLSLDLLFASYGKHIPFLVFHNMSSVLPEIVRKSVNKNNTITLEDIAKERYKVMQVEFFKKTSKNLKVTEAEFIRFYVRQYENSLKEAKSLLTLFLLAKFILPFIVGGDDDDNKEKDTYRTTLDIVIVVLTRSLREQSFVFNPEQLKIMLLQGPIPTIGTAWNLIDSYIYAPLKETYFTLTGDDEALKTNRVIDKQLNATPAKGINKIVKQISPSYRKLLDARRPKIQ